MRKDQFDRLDDLAQRVGEVFITEADPDNWNGAGVPLRDLDEKARGNRYWDKKNAIQTGALLARVFDLIERGKTPNGGPLIHEDDAEEQIKRYEKKAKELIRGIQEGTAAKR